VGLAVEVALAALFHLPGAGAYGGVPGALGALVAVAVAVLAGRRAGGAVALGGALSLVVFANGSLWTIPIWVATAFLAGLGFEHLRQRLGEASMLQMGLLPSAAAVTPPLLLTTRTRPGGQLPVAGDFMDVVQALDGSVAVVIGDVSGHGPKAAALGVMLRAAWRGLIRGQAEPARVIEALSALVEDERRSPEAFATVCCAWLDAGHAGLHIVLAGHPPPVLVTRSSVEPLRAPANPPLGILPGEAQGARVELPAEGAWSLVFYTDGLIEGRARPGSSDRFGLERLVLALDGSRERDRPDRPDLDRVIREAQSANGGRLDDDVGVVLLACDAAPVGVSTA
jgi:serine phosphatase RsbU (regulator of sigma subunit)